MLRKWLWTRVTVAAVRTENRIQKHSLPVDSDIVIPEPIERRYPGLKGCPLKLSRIVPASERRAWSEEQVFRLILKMKKWFPLRAGYSTPYPDEGAPYPKAFESLEPRPEIPEDFKEGADKTAGLA